MSAPANFDHPFLSSVAYTANNSVVFDARRMQSQVAATVAPSGNGFLIGLSCDRQIY